MKYEAVLKECTECGIMRDDGQCRYNHYLSCNGYQCVIVHWFRHTRPTNILANLDMEAEYAEDMDEG